MIIRSHSTIILLLLFLLCTSFLRAEIDKQFSDAESLFAAGKIDAFAGSQLTLKPSNNDEKAFLGYYNAVLEKNTANSMKSFALVSQNYPSSLYGQMALLEIAKLNILDREIAQAVINLKKITSTDMIEKSYWLAFCSYQQNDYQNAINHAENFLRLSKTNQYLEDTYFLIVESYISLRQANSAVKTLNKLKAINGFPTDLQFYYFRLGYAYELSGNRQDAVASYRDGYLLNKYSQVAYLIEDRLFELRTSFGSSIDLSFLYPYTELSITPPVVDSGSTSTNIMPLPNNDQKIDLKADAKPTGEYLIQAGRFSSESNASKLVVKIKSLELPSVYYEAIQNKQKTWVVVCGPYNTQQEADAAHSKLKDNDIDSFITKN